MKRLPSKYCGMTLIEVLVVIAILGILTALALPAVQAARETARRMQCHNNIRQIGIALHTYHDGHRAFPPGGMIGNELSWHVLILPMLEQNTLHARFNFDAGPYYSPVVNNKNNPHSLVCIPQYLCPSGSHQRSLTSADSVNGEHAYTTHYYGIMGPRGSKPDGGFYKMSSAGPFAEQGLLGYEASKRMADIIDGSSTTFVIGEISWDDANGYRTWVRGVNGEPMSGAKNVSQPINTYFYNNNYFNNGNASGFNDISLGSEHPGGTQVAMGDGAVRFISETVDMIVYKSGASINGAEKTFLPE